MKQPVVYCMLFALCLFCSFVRGISAAEYGVGFNLALDYG